MKRHVEPLFGPPSKKIPIFTTSTPPHSFIDLCSSVPTARTMVMTTTMGQSTTTAPQQALRGGGLLLSWISYLVLTSCLSTASAFTRPTIITRTHTHADIKFNKVSRCYGRNDQYYDDDEDDDYYDDDEEDDYRSNNKRRRRDNLGRGKQSSGLNLPSSFGKRDGWRLPDSVSKSLLAGIFILGVGLGVTVDSQVNTNPKDLASRDAIDQAAPNPTLCAKLGASAMAFDQRVFVSFNPFNVYVSQADVKPACVLLEANVVPILKAKGLINDEEVRSCKQNMNTWAFVGDLDEKPQLSCVYRSQDAQNEFLSNPKVGLGEDYLDDDRAKASGKIVKGGLTDAQKDLVRRKTAGLPSV